MLNLTGAEVLAAYCNGTLDEALKEISAFVTKSYTNMEPQEIAAGYMIFAANDWRALNPTSDEAECHNLMRDEGTKSIPELLWDILGHPVQTKYYAWFYRGKAAKLLEKRIE